MTKTEIELPKRKRGRPSKNGTAAAAKETAPVRAERKPRERRRPMRIVRGLVRCRMCGCSELEACAPTCAWAQPDLCDSCESAVTSVSQWMLRAHRPSWNALKREVEALVKSNPTSYLDRMFAAPPMPEILEPVRRR